MEPSTLAAIVAGTFSLLVAVVSSIVALISVRRTGIASKELERYRFQLESKRDSTRITRQVLEKRAEVMGRACTFIQYIRDDVRRFERLLSAHETDNEPIESIRIASRELGQLYATSHYALGELDRAILHDAKMQSDTLAARLEKYQGRSEDRLRGILSRDILLLLDALSVAQKFLIREYERLTEILAQLPEPLSDRYQPLVPVRF